MYQHFKRTYFSLNTFHRSLTLGFFTIAVLITTIFIASNINSPQTFQKKAAQNCTYSATVKVLRADGLALDGTEKVGTIELGIIDNKSASLRKADQILNDQGTFSFSTNNFTFSPYKNGDNSYVYLTNLNTDNWQVTGAFCNQRNNSKLGCDRKPSLIPARPLVSAYSTVDQNSWTDPQIGPLHVTCGVDIEYGWIIAPISTQLPKAPNIPSVSKIPHAEILHDLAGYASIDGSTTGGFTTNTQIRVVKSNADKGPQSLREAVAGNDPKIVIFQNNADITLKSQVLVGSNTSLLALDKKITIQGRGLRIEKSNNVIISGIQLVKGLQDAIEIRNSHHIWIDRILAQNFTDGLVDIVGGTKTTKSGSKITNASHHITISRSRFGSHEKVMLISNDIIDTQVDKITLWGNYFVNFGQRSPRVRYATVDMYNNVIENWSNSAIRSTLGATVNVENNIFIAPSSDKLIKRFAENFNQEPGHEPGNIILKGNFSTNDKLQKLINTSQLSNPKASFVRPYPAYPPSMKQSSKLPYPASSTLFKTITSYTSVL